MMILEVDDDSDDREIFLADVKNVDSTISCVQVGSGSEALEFLTNASSLPDFIFMDINMPKMSGYECVNLIGSMPRMKAIQIVMYSTAFAPEDRERFSRQGIKYLGKTARFPDLIESIKELISEKVFL